MEQLAILPNTDLTKYISGSILLFKYMYLLFKKISIEQISHPQTLQNNKLKAINVDDFKNKYLHRAGIQGAMIHHHFWEEIQLKSSHHFSAYHKPLMLDHCPVEPIEYHHLSSAGLNTLSHIEKHSNHRNISSGRPATDTTKTGWTGKET